LKALDTMTGAGPDRNRYYSEKPTARNLTASPDRCQSPCLRRSEPRFPRTGGDAPVNRPISVSSCHPPFRTVELRQASGFRASRSRGHHAHRWYPRLSPHPCPHAEGTSQIAGTASRPLPLRPAGTPVCRPFPFGILL